MRRMHTWTMLVSPSGPNVNSDALVRGFEWLLKALLLGIGSTIMTSHILAVRGCERGAILMVDVWPSTRIHNVLAFAGLIRAGC